jgi:geranylgeranyl pyrophosphate synthase
MVRKPMKLEAILRPVSAELKTTEKEIEAQLEHIYFGSVPGYRSIIRRSVHHLFDTPGKRLRPALVLLGVKAATGFEHLPVTPLVKVAAAVELVHSASLIHDDVIDEENIRRNQESMNAAYGNKIAVLVGDLLYSQLFSILTNLVELGTESQRTLFDLFCSTTQKMCMGEIYEETIRKRGDAVVFEEYLSIIEYKTASLMEACGRISAVVARMDEGISSALSSYGLNLGLSYQIVDDVLDGDSIFHDAALMFEKAIMYGKLAKESLRPLKENPATAGLHALVELVLLKAKQIKMREIRVPAHALGGVQ